MGKEQDALCGTWSVLPADVRCWCGFRLRLHYPLPRPTTLRPDAEESASVARSRLREQIPEEHSPEHSLSLSSTVPLAQPARLISNFSYIARSRESGSFRSSTAQTQAAGTRLRPASCWPAPGDLGHIRGGLCRGISCPASGNFGRNLAVDMRNRPKSLLRLSFEPSLSIFAACVRRPSGRRCARVTCRGRLEPRDRTE